VISNELKLAFSNHDLIQKLTVVIIIHVVVNMENVKISFLNTNVFVILCIQVNIVKNVSKRMSLNRVKTK
jgi:hypothetical protein